MVERALEIKSDSADALGILALSSAFIALSGRSESQIDSANKAIEAAHLAIAVNPNDINALVGRAYGEMILGLHQQAVVTARHCSDINPNDPTALIVLSQVLVYNGDYEEAVRVIEKCEELMLRSVHRPSLYHGLCLAYFANGNCDKAIMWCEKMVQEFPEFPITHIFALACVENGELNRARNMVNRLMDLAPKSSIRLTKKVMPAKDPNFLHRIENGLRNAGLPE